MWNNPVVNKETEEDMRADMPRECSRNVLDSGVDIGLDCSQTDGADFESRDQIEVHHDIVIGD